MSTSSTRRRSPSLARWRSGLINFVGFRRRFLEMLKTLGRALRAVADRPADLGCFRPLVRLVLESRLARLLWRFVIKPLVVSAPFGRWAS